MRAAGMGRGELRACSQSAAAQPSRRAKESGRGRLDPGLPYNRRKLRTPDRAPTIHSTHARMSEPRPSPAVRTLGSACPAQPSLAGRDQCGARALPPRRFLSPRHRRPARQSNPPLARRASDSTRRCPSLRTHAAFVFYAGVVRCAERRKHGRASLRRIRWRSDCADRARTGRCTRRWTSVAVDCRVRESPA